MRVRPCVHVLCGHNEDALWADPVLGGRGLQRDALEVEDAGARLATDDIALFVADPAVAVVGRVLQKRSKVYFDDAKEDKGQRKGREWVGL